MNVLYFVNTVGMYGANHSLIDMLEELKKRHVNGYVVIMQDGDLKRELRKRGIKTYIVSYETNSAIKNTLTFTNKCKRLAKNIQCLQEIKKIIDTNNIDIIHSNASNIDIGAIAAFRYNLPHVFHVREILLDDYGLSYDFPTLSRFFLSKAKKIIAISEYVQKKRKLGKNSIVLYNGINLEKYSISKKALFTSDKLHILYCGVISHQKGVMDVVKAVRYLIQKGYVNIELSIVGGESPYGLKIKKYVRQNHLEKYIYFHGYQQDVLEFRKKADVAVMTSRSEALGRVTIESMLGEVLVIGADCGATSELIRDGITGYLYEPGNIKHLASILDGIKENKEKNVSIVENAKNFALDNFDREKYVNEIISIYRSLL